MRASTRFIILFNVALSMLLIIGQKAPCLSMCLEPPVPLQLPDVPLNVTKLFAAAGGHHPAPQAQMATAQASTVGKETQYWGSCLDESHGDTEGWGRAVDTMLAVAKQAGAKGRQLPQKFMR